MAHRYIWNGNDWSYGCVIFSYVFERCSREMRAKNAAYETHDHENSNFTLRLSLMALRCAGFWPPEGLAGYKHFLYNSSAFICFMYILGIYLIIQIVDLYLIWGNLPLMTGTAFLLFTNFAQGTKFLNLLLRKKVIFEIVTESDAVLRAEKSAEERNIVKSCDRETRLQYYLYLLLTFVTTMGWATSAEKSQLPLRAWYPYDTTKSPAYELTYLHQISAICVAAFLNVSKDTLVTTLIAQCRCRLRLVGLGFRNLCNDRHVCGEPTTKDISLIPSPKTLVLTPAQESILHQRIRIYAIQHQKALEAAMLLQQSFSEPTFAQFSVSLVIICVTAFQLVSQTGNLVRLFSMGTYLLTMTMQVFLYCYQGDKLLTESEEVAVAAYEFPWYACGVSIRRSLLIIMQRCRRPVRLTAGGFTTLSLASFTTIIKTSYSLFTMLKQVTE